MKRDLLDYLPSTLVVTPKPQHGESYMGFVLRTSEANGYPSINTILRHAGMTENEMRSVRPPLEKLAPLYGRAVEDFALLGETRTTNGRFLPLMSQSLPAIYLRSKCASRVRLGSRPHSGILGNASYDRLPCAWTHGAQPVSAVPPTGRLVATRANHLQLWLRLRSPPW